MLIELCRQRGLAATRRRRSGRARHDVISATSKLRVDGGRRRKWGRSSGDREKKGHTRFREKRKEENIPKRCYM
jgi:hypothetical protein